MSDSGKSQLAIRRRPIPRKGHRKSRAGCLVCKRRKVKCDEATPTCGSCNRLGLACQYVQDIDMTDGSDGSTSPASLAVGTALRNVPTNFSMKDLRFFHHFLFSAYPNLPVGGWHVWQQVGQMSHQYDFLVHSMLALGASHLGTLNGQGYEREALNHRVYAIKALNAHLAKPNLTVADGDAAFGTLLNLLFQSVYITEGMVDFFSMIRGCYVVGDTLLPDFERSSFKTFARKVYIQKINDLAISKDRPSHSLDRAIAEGFCDSLRNLGPLCRSISEIEHLAHMQKIMTIATFDPLESYHELTFLYDKLGEMSPEMFHSFMDPENQVSRLVLVHFLTLELIMSRKALDDLDRHRHLPTKSKGQSSNDIMRSRWIEDIISRMPPMYKKYASWVSGFVRNLSFASEPEDELWKPFLLHRGTIIVSGTGLEQRVEEI